MAPVTFTISSCTHNYRGINDSSLSYTLKAIQMSQFTEPCEHNETATKHILASVTTGGFTHAGGLFVTLSPIIRRADCLLLAPVLEICKVLADRGYTLDFATNLGQEAWVEDYPFIRHVHISGPAPTNEETEAHYRRMLDRVPTAGLSSIMQSKYLWDSYWTDTYTLLKRIMLNSQIRPDFVIADFFADAAMKDMMIEFGVPIAIVWPQIPYLMAPVSYIPGQPGSKLT